ncbi:MAG: acyl-CoA thioesterase [Halobacteriaceae archaeon]
MTDFAFETVVPTRYADFDTYGHVNNAIQATYLEEGRIAYFTEIIGGGGRELGILIASLSVDFVEPDSVTVGVGTTNIGEKSFELEYEVEAEGRTVATASTVQVAYDRLDDQTIRVPDSWRNAIIEFEGEERELA